MGIERPVVAAKIEPENKLLLDRMVTLLAPLGVTLSSVVNAILTFNRLQCAGSVDPAAALLQLLLGSEAFPALTALARVTEPQKAPTDTKEKDVRRTA